jgi:hypothetical protein
MRTERSVRHRLPAAQGVIRRAAKAERSCERRDCSPAVAPKGNWSEYRSGSSEHGMIEYIEIFGTSVGSVALPENSGAL